MKNIARIASTIMLLACASGAQGATLQGWLELQWGDPASAAVGKTQLRAYLATDDGRRYPLDVTAALAAADDLYALANRRVAVELSPGAVPGPVYHADAIVPADNLHLPLGEAGHDAVLGNTRWVTLMCKFSDIPTEQKSLGFFQSQYGNNPGQLNHYWREVSYGKIDLTGSSAQGWFTLPQPRAYYVSGGGQGSANLNQLFNDCVGAADPTVDFAANGGLQGINMMFNGDLDGYAWGGARCVTLDGLFKCWSSTWNPPWAFNNIAPLTHEMGHGYGLPHANNSDGDADPYDNPWDVMSGAWANAVVDPVYGTLAKHLNVYHRDRLGWIDPARMVALYAGQERVVQLDRASLPDSTATQMLLVSVPNEGVTHYTLEARQRVDLYEANLAGNAVIIHSVYSNRREPSWSVDAQVPPANVANNEGSMFKVGEVWTAPGGSFMVRILSENATGFRVAVCGPIPTPELGAERRTNLCLGGAGTRKPIGR